MSDSTNYPGPSPDVRAAIAAAEKSAAAAHPSAPPAPPAEVGQPVEALLSLYRSAGLL